MRRLVSRGAIVALGLGVACCSPAGVRDRVAGVRAWAERGAMDQEEHRVESFAREYSVGGRSQPFERWPTETGEVTEAPHESAPVAPPQVIYVVPGQ